ncbi:uncharacterized protein EDB93DRAFT_1175624 [Suillus bovinus]|uniref:uncharacterized protein n=1 Tax=Suillus bovinus TaxID=48563 RepID=UPI001B860E83|nr:uncharacterized protein EDB93DRAFT_1175624 [Suillus bovinus]KAG2132853.1 hypothetical protein EDB93DRAFT_1175624 [Suillus bovinus]
MALSIVLATAFWSLTIIIFAARHVTRTRTHRTAIAVRAMLRPRNIEHKAEIRSRVHPHEHVALTPSSAILDPSRHDDFVQGARELIASVSPQQCVGWQRYVKCAEKCTEIFLPSREVDFAAFIQSVTFCIIITGFYGVDPGTLFPDDIVFMTNALDRHSLRETPICPGELDAMRERVCRWVGEERATQALETILPAYESMWHLAAVTLAYVNGNRHTQNAFLDFSENPTQKQFRSFKVKNTRPSVEAIINEVLRLHPPIQRIARKSEHPLWKRLFCPAQEIADIEAVHRSCAYGTRLETFDAMRFHPQHENPVDMQLLAFGHGELSCVAEEWAPIATALIVAKVIDRVDDVGFVLVGNIIDARMDRNTRTD